jgi:hypothetical protein
MHCIFMKKIDIMIHHKLAWQEYTVKITYNMFVVEDDDDLPCPCHREPVSCGALEDAD